MSEDELTQEEKQRLLTLLGNEIQENQEVIKESSNKYEKEAWETENQELNRIMEKL